MHTNTRPRASRQEVEALLARFAATKRGVEIEQIAARLGASGDRDAVRPLLASLCDQRIQADPHAENAVCDALVALDVMRPVGEGSYALQPRYRLGPDVSRTIADLGAAMPLRYLIGGSLAS